MYLLIQFLSRYFCKRIDSLKASSDVVAHVGIRDKEIIYPLPPLLLPQVIEIIQWNMRLYGFYSRVAVHNENERVCAANELGMHYN